MADASIFASVQAQGEDRAAYIVPCATDETSRHEPKPNVSTPAGRLSGGVLHDPDETFDYFQAQGRRGALNTGRQQ